MTRSAWLIAGAAAFVLTAGAASAGAADSLPVSIEFVLTNAGTPVHCGTPLVALGSGSSAASLRDARIYLQDPALIDETGTAVAITLTENDWQTATTVLLDFTDGVGGCKADGPARHPVITGNVPSGRYGGLSFTIGVPRSLNHTSTESAPPPLDIAAMGWSWQAGRKFIKIEVDPRGGVRKPDGGTAPTWFVHLGSTDCAGNPLTGDTVTCQRANRIPVTFPAFDPATQAVSLDLASLFQGTDLSRDQGGAVGCMSSPIDADCPPVFARLGLSLATGQPLTTGQATLFQPVSRP